MHFELRVVVRRADHERPLCGKAEGSDVLKELPKFSLGSYAHSSIRVQEGQPSSLDLSRLKTDGWLTVPASNSCAW